MYQIKSVGKRFRAYLLFHIQFFGDEIVLFSYCLITGCRTLYGSCYLFPSLGDAFSFLLVFSVKSIGLISSRLEKSQIRVLFFLYLNLIHLISSLLKLPRYVCNDYHRFITVLNSYLENILNSLLGNTIYTIQAPFAYLEVVKVKNYKLTSNRNRREFFLYLFAIEVCQDRGGMWAVPITDVLRPCRAGHGSSPTVAVPRLWHDTASQTCAWDLPRGTIWGARAVLMSSHAHAGPPRRKN